MEGVDNFENYSPVVYWTTVRLITIFSINQGYYTRQVVFSNVFVKATSVEDVYLSLQYYFDSDTGEDRANMAMKINKSLYGLVQTPLYW